MEITRPEKHREYPNAHVKTAIGTLVLGFVSEERVCVQPLEVVNKYGGFDTKVEINGVEYCFNSTINRDGGERFKNLPFVRDWDATRAVSHSYRNDDSSKGLSPAARTKLEKTVQEAIDAVLEAYPSILLEAAQYDRKALLQVIEIKADELRDQLKGLETQEDNLLNEIQDITERLEEIKAGS